LHETDDVVGMGSHDGDETAWALSGYPSLAAAVHAGFGAKYRAQITLEQVQAILAELDLKEAPADRTAPRLRIRRLRFTGHKALAGEERCRPIAYDQAFLPGVNVLLIEANDVGKSSVLKTIKFALTGDDSDYDRDVKGWIENIWLTFALDAHVYTVILSTRESLRGALVLGEEERLIDQAVTSPAVLWEAASAEELKEELRRFFFRNLGLRPLAWTYQADATGPVRTPRTTWLTYFQALQILDDHYLLCDAQHRYGNQEGLILSAFLGLRLSEALNKVGVEAKQTEKEQKAKVVRTEGEARAAQEEIMRLEADIAELRAALAGIDREQQRRREAIRDASPAVRLVEVQTDLATRAAERRQLLEERDDLGRRIRQAHGEARCLREAVKFRRHFTGLTVRVCPSCDGEVDPAAVVREENEHLCRLCGRTPPSASAAEVSAMEAQAADAEARAVTMERERSNLSRRIQVLHREIGSLTQETNTLHEAARRGIDAALPTPEEETERLRLAEQIGDLSARIRSAQSKVEAQVPDLEEAAIRARVLKKAWEVLRAEAERRNVDFLQRFSVLTGDVIRRIGAESITDITVQPLGGVRFAKSGTPITFGSLQSQGDRLRVKLACFLTMIRLGREPGMGHHPGLLLIDQPGGAEMVTTDCSALAAVFRTIEQDLADDVQIICFTSRREMAEATEPGKIYGGQGDDGCAF